MSKIMRRIDRLEEQTGMDGQPGIRLIVMCAGLALDLDRCVEILGERGFLRSGPGMSMLNFGDIPEGLNAHELEQQAGDLARRLDARQTFLSRDGRADRSWC